VPAFVSGIYIVKSLSKMSAMQVLVWSCCLDFTLESGAELAKDSLDVPLHIAALMSARLGYNWLLAGPPVYSDVMLDTVLR
jgi:hypothetical protein